MKRLIAAVTVSLLILCCASSAQDRASSREKALKCAENWSKQGFDFDPNSMTCSQMFERATAVRRAAYWREKGYVFDPNRLTWQEMDTKAQDVDRARYWAARGYRFDPNTMTCHEMDSRAAELDKVRYWKAIGYHYDVQTKAVYLTPAKRTRLSSLPSPDGLGGGPGPSSYTPSANSTPAYWGSRASTHDSCSTGLSSVAENGSYYGQLSETTGRAKTVHVRGYYRSDGTYVRSHYRSAPRR